MELHIFKSADELNHAVAEWIVGLIKSTLSDSDRFCWLLSGGNTPKQLYTLLATDPYKKNINWSKLHIFFGDERVVPFSDERNNGNMAYQALLSHVPIPENQIHYIKTEVAAAESAKQYEQLIDDYFDKGSVTFDLSLLGIGDDAHTLSVFPGSNTIQETKRKAFSLYLSEQNMFRVTVSPQAVNASMNTAFLATGISKAAAVKHVLRDNYKPELYPAQLIMPQNNQLHWFIDQAAASQL